MPTALLAANGSGLREYETTPSRRKAALMLAAHLWASHSIWNASAAEGGGASGSLHHLPLIPASYVELVAALHKVQAVHVHKVLRTAAIRWCSSEL